MNSPNTADISDFKSVLELINQVFRISRGFEPTMQAEFPILLNEKNIENITVIKENEKLVSAASYLPWDISIEGVKIKAASIGAVCTAEAYRGLGYSSRTLDFAEQKMKACGIDLLLVSGTRALYKRRGLVEVKSFYEYRFEPENLNLDFSLMDYENAYLSEILRLYAQNSTRYFRTREEFETLLYSATIPWGIFSYKVYLIKSKENIVGYIAIKISDGETAEVMELFGAQDIVKSALSQLAYKLGLKYINYAVHFKDRKNILAGIKASEINNRGTIKLLNFKGFMEKLRPYFSQYISEELLNELEFRELEEGYCIALEHESLLIKDIGEVTKLVFEGNTDKLELSGREKLSEIIAAVFPIPFVWTANLNYQ